MKTTAIPALTRCMAMIPSVPLSVDPMSSTMLRKIRQSAHTDFGKPNESVSFAH